MIKIPANNQWKVDSASEILGQINYTQGVNFDDSGYLSITPKPISLFSSVSDANFGIPLKTLYFNSKYFILTDQDCWEIDNSGSTPLVFTNITDAEANRPAPNKASDAVIWQNRVYVSSDTTTDVRYWTGSAWADPTISISTSLSPHPMAIMGNFTNGYLAIGEDNTVRLYNTSHTLQTTLTINNNYTITCLLYRQNNLYIGTKANDGGDAKLFIWNGSGTVAQNEYGVSSNWIFSLSEFDSSFVLVTNEGELLRWNGGGFDILAVFPVFNSPYRWSANVGSVIGKVAMNGMVNDGDILYINIDGSVASAFTLGASQSFDSAFLPNQPSGLWCFDPKVGLYNRTPHSRDGYTSFTALSLASDVLTLSANTNIRTGDPLFCVANGSLTGIADITTYYAIKVDVNQIKLANTPADAVAGTAITLGGSVTSASFFIANYNQSGDSFQFASNVGGAGLIHSDTASPQVFPDLFKSYYLWGFTDSDSVSRLCIQSRIPNIGIFSTVKILAAGIKDIWNKIFASFQDFYLDSDRIIVRYKTRERQNLPTVPISGTYSSDQVIGTADNLIDLAIIGDSVHIISGNGAGNIRTIESIIGDEIRLTEPLIGVTAGNTVVFYIDSWKEAHNFSTSSETVSDDYIESTLGESHSVWIKLLFEVRGMIKTSEVRVVNKPHKETNKIWQQLKQN